jgi:hypothetical protein
VEERVLAAEGFVEDGLVAVGLGGRHGHALHRGAPLVAGDDAAVVGAEANEHDAVPPVALADELADVDHAGAQHVGRAGVADALQQRIQVAGAAQGPRERAKAGGEAGGASRAAPREAVANRLNSVHGADPHNDICFSANNRPS